MSSTVLADRILAPGGLTTLFQPVVSIRGGSPVLHSYECLTRGPFGTNLRSADVLFEYVRFKRIEAEVDRACVASALATAAGLPGRPALSINVHSVSLGRDHFVDTLEKCARAASIGTGRLTVEVVEHSPAMDSRPFFAELARLRNLGVAIALDDVGHGHSNYSMMIDIEPDYLKIDKYFVSSCDTHPKRRAVLESIFDLARRFDARVIAEGVERPEELAVLREIGIDLVQGYLFGRPGPASSFTPRSSPDLLLRDAPGARPARASFPVDIA